MSEETELGVSRSGSWRGVCRLAVFGEFDASGAGVTLKLVMVKVRTVFDRSVIVKDSPRKILGEGKENG